MVVVAEARITRHGGRYQRIVATALALCGSVTVGWADGKSWSDPKRVVNVWVGIFCPPAVTSKSEGTDTISGDISRYKARPLLGRATNLIPAEDHILFGIEGRERPHP